MPPAPARSCRHTRRRARERIRASAERGIALLYSATGWSSWWRSCCTASAPTTAPPCSSRLARSKKRSLMVLLCAGDTRCTCKPTGWRCSRTGASGPTIDHGAGQGGRRQARRLPREGRLRGGAGSEHGRRSSRLSQCCCARPRRCRWCNGSSCATRWRRRPSRTRRATCRSPRTTAAASTASPGSRKRSRCARPAAWGSQARGVRDLL